MHVLDDFDHCCVFVNKFSLTLVDFCVSWEQEIIICFIIYECDNSFLMCVCVWADIILF